MESDKFDQLLRYRDNDDQQDPENPENPEDSIYPNTLDNIPTNIYVTDVTDVSVPKWITEVELLRDNIQTIRHDIKQLVELHNKQLLVTFDETSSKSEIIDKLTNKIMKLFQTTNIRLKQFSYNLSNNHEDHMKNNYKVQLATELLNLSRSFKIHQKKYMDNLAAQTSNNNLMGISDEEYIDVDIDDASMFTFNKQLHTYVKDEEDILIDSYVSTAQHQSKYIRDIARSIEELASIMNDFAILVDNQSEILDRIDTNVETAEYHVEAATEQLKIVHKEVKKDGCSKYIIIALAVAIIITLILIIIKHSIN